MNSGQTSPPQASQSTLTSPLLPKKRSEVQVHETWDLTDLFSDFASWEKAFLAIPETAKLEQELELNYRGLLAKLGPGKIFSLLQRRDELARALDNLYVYAKFRSCEDLQEVEPASMIARIEAKYAAIKAVFAFVEPELLAIPELAQWSNTEPLVAYRFELSELLRQRPHVLSEKEEAIFAQFSPVVTKFSDIHSRWMNVELKFSPAEDEKGERHPVTFSRLSSLLESSSRVLRKNAFTSLNSEMAKWRHTIATNYQGRLQAGSIEAKLRGFSSFRASMLHSDHVSEALYDRLVTFTRQNLGLLHRSMALRKRVLALPDEVAPFDRGPNLARIAEPKRFGFSEACELVLQAVAPLGEEYVAIARRGLLQERWVDYAENQGKRTGAFSGGSYDSRPYLFLNWMGNLDDVFTLAHELGHSMHTYFSNKNQPYHNASYTIFVAEVASTLCESLLAHHVLHTWPSDSDFAKQVLSQRLRQFEGTVLRQVLFATFERDVSAKVDQGVPLNPDEMDEHYEKLNREWFGPEALFPSLARHEWMRIPHFYSPFYVYKYATSFCAAAKLSHELLNSKGQGPGSRTDVLDRIFRFLRAGRSASSLQILAEAGVDMENEETYRAAFEGYERQLSASEATF